MKVVEMWKDKGTWASENKSVGGLVAVIGFDMIFGRAPSARYLWTGWVYVDDVG